MKLVSTYILVLVVVILELSGKG